MEKFLIFFVIIMILGSIAMYIVNKVRRALRSVVSDVTTLKELFDDTQEVIKQDTPKSVSGATDVYLRQISKDFPDFHAPEAEIDIRNRIADYLNVRYAGKSAQDVAGVEKDFWQSVPKEPKGTLGNVCFNKIAICGYKKSADYATISYQVSVGFAYNSQIIQTRYCVEYTLRLSQNNIATLATKCPNCGASIDDTTSLVCPYCDIKIIRDTILTWTVSMIKEI